GGRPNIDRRSAGIRYNRSRARPGRAQRPFDRPARTLPDPAKEFCSSGDRADVQGSSREVVDRLAEPPYEISPAGRASCTSMVEPLHRRVSEPSEARSAWAQAAHERALDLLHDRSADDDQEPRDADLQNHSRNDRRKRVAAPVPHRGSLNRGDVWWQYSPPRK